MSKRSLKWTLGAYSRSAGQFTDLGKYDTPMAACESVGKKAWVYDSNIGNYVLYDPIKHTDTNRVDCGKTPAEAYHFYHAAYRLSCPQLSIVWQTHEQNSQKIKDTENIILRTGERVQLLANQNVEWEMNGLNWGEFGKGTRRAILVSYKPNDTVVLKATNECGVSQLFTIKFLAREYTNANLSADNANTNELKLQIKQILVNIWGDKFNNLPLEQITPEITDLVQKAANEIIHQSQGMLIVDITYNFFLTGIPTLKQLVFSQTATISGDVFAPEITNTKTARDVLATYKSWFAVYERKKAHQSVINVVALKYRAELEVLLASQ